MTTEQADFTSIVESYGRELHIHCYRMLGSFQESEDLVQETFLRAWRKRETFEGRASFRAWLYRIATNACLDAIARRRREVPRADGAGPPAADLPWLEPYPDSLLDQVSADEAEPAAAVVSKETIELAYLVAIQHLPPRQRAALILRDVLDWSAKDTAELLEVSVPAANSALQRARETMKEHLPEHRLEWAPGSDADEEERALLQRYMEATERDDAAAFVEMMREDARFSMPPEPGSWTGREAIVAAWVEGGFGSPDWGHMRCVATRANRQPAVAGYVRKPGDADYRLLAVDVLRIQDGAIADIVTFSGPALSSFGLPPTL
jgi:RNA polymerase sigma-70 factor (ECF subfamily)